MFSLLLKIMTNNSWQSLAFNRLMWNLMSMEVVKRQQGLKIRLWLQFCHLVAVWLGPCFGQVLYISEPVFLRCKIGMEFPRWLIVKESACSAGDINSIPGSGRSLGEGNDNPSQYSCLENPMNRGTWWTIVMGSQSWIQWLNSSSSSKNRYFFKEVKCYF